jgi:protein SCO1/2
MALDDDNRAFRIPAGMLQMLSYFDSGVNYIGSVVNQHATELFIVGPDGQITNRFQQLQWQVPEVIAELRKQLTRDRRRKVFPQSLRSLLRNIVSFLPSISIAFLPKCPLCWASYVSVLGITDIQILNFTPWLLPALVVLLVIHLLSLLKGADKRNGLLPFFLALAGAFCILLFGLWMNVRWSGYIGTALILCGSVLNSLDQYVFTRMRLRVMRVRAALHLP